MGTKQWLFWATAVPVTVLVMGLAVVAVLSFDPVRGFWARLVQRDRRQRVGREEHVVPRQGRRPTVVYGPPVGAPQ